MVTARCKYCRQRFEYEVKVAPVRRPSGEMGARKVSRDVCDDCQASRQRWLTKKTRPRRALGIGAVAGEFTSRHIIAKKLGLTYSQAEELERRALFKLRSSSELKQAYDKFKEAGMPLVEEIREQIRAAVAAREEDRILELQLQLLDMWQVHDLAKALGMTDDARRAKGAIARCRRALNRELGLKTGLRD
jgi:hypothetical protein